MFSPTHARVYHYPSIMLSHIGLEPHGDASPWGTTVVELAELETFNTTQDAQPIHMHVLHQRNAQHGRAATTLSDQTL